MFSTKYSRRWYESNNSVNDCIALGWTIHLCSFIILKDSKVDDLAQSIKAISFCALRLNQHQIKQSFNPRSFSRPLVRRQIQLTSR